MTAAARLKRGMDDSLARTAVPALLLAVIASILLATWAESASAIRPLGPAWQRGAIIPPDTNTYSSQRSDNAIAALQAAGGTHVNLYVEWFMRNSNASALRSTERTATDRSLLHAMSTARAKGMASVLTLVVRSRDGTWQALINPRDRDRWFASYRRMAKHYAALARRGGAQMMVIGAELESMIGYTSKWRKIIRLIRARFPGRLTYSSNQVDGARRVEFWPQLDYVGMAGYMPLARGRNPSVRRLVRSWKDRGYVRAARRLHQRYRKPVVFTEVGYGSWKGTAARPPASVDGPISQVPQQRAYEALYRVWSQYDWFHGLYWWRWDAARPDPRDGSHNPRGKRAERTMRAWNTAR
ncbi:MAG: glycoside hydrolase family 113 [Thermoleophilaceae bacterium]